MRKRREIVDMYRDGLEGIPGIRLPAEIPGNRHSWFVFAIRVEARIRNKLIEKLNAQGIQSKAYFDPCIHLQPFYRKEFGYKPGSFPIAEKISSEVIILPFYTKLTEAQVDFVCLTLKKLMRSLG
jgi:perosamine synthetase